MANTNIGTTGINTGIATTPEKVTFEGYASSFTYYNNTDAFVTIDFETGLMCEGMQVVPPCTILEVSMSSDTFACITLNAATAGVGNWFVNWFRDNDSESCGQSGNPDYTKLTPIPKTEIIGEVSIVQPSKCFLHNIQVPDPDNPKKSIWVEVYKDSITGSPCYFPIGTASGDLIPENQLIINQDFAMNENRMGQLILASNLIPNEFPFPSDGIVICHDGTDQDIPALIKGSALYTAFLADLAVKFPLPEGARYDLSKISAEQINGIPKVAAHCDVLDTDVVISSNAQVQTTILGNASKLTVGGYKKLSEAQKDIDLIVDGKCVTCTDEACAIADGDMVFNGEANTASQFDFCVRCYAPDPAATKTEG